MKRGNSSKDLEVIYVDSERCRKVNKVSRLDPQLDPNQREREMEQVPKPSTSRQNNVDNNEGSKMTSSNRPPTIESVIHECELIVMKQELTRYAEVIEKQLKDLRISTDIIYPNEGVPANRMVRNMAAGGCIYAVVIDESCRQKCSMKIYLIQSLLPHEERFLSVEDGIALISYDHRRRQNDSNSDSTIQNNSSPVSKSSIHPESIQKAFETLMNSRDLTVPQYDEVIHYLSVKRDEILRIQVEDLNDLASNPSIVNSSRRRELQSKIMGFLDKHEVFSNGRPDSNPNHRNQTSNRHPGPQPPAGIGHPNEVLSLLNNPNIQRAVDNLLQANVLQDIGIRAPAARTNQHQSGQRVLTSYNKTSYGAHPYPCYANIRRGSHQATR